MSKLKKSICKWKKSDMKDHFGELKKAVENPKYICSKCGRAANDKAYLCKPESLD